MKMKIRIYIIESLIIILIASCSIDNYDMPNATLSGEVLDNVTNEMVQNGGVNSGTIIQMFEGNSIQPILSYSYPDGHFTNAALFTGTYKLFAVGAFRFVDDTMKITVTSSTTVEVKVLPNVRLKVTLVSVSSDGTTATVNVEYTRVHSDEVLNQLAVIWSTIDNPNMYTYFGGNQTTETVSSQNLTTGEKTYTISGLNAGTKYFIRAAGRTNAAGNYYNYSATIKTP